MKNSILIIGVAFIVLIVVGVVFVFSPVSEPTEATTFKAGDSFPFAEQFFLVEMTGETQGIYLDNYVDPEFTSFFGSSLLFESVAANQISIGYGICGDIIAHRALGLPIKILGTYVTGNPWRVLVKGDSSLQSIEDLDGKRIGTSGVRGIDHLLGVIIENKFGIKLEFVPLGGVPQMLAGISSGDVDAFIQTPGPTQALADAGKLKVLFEIADALPSPWPSFCIWATEDMIENNKDEVKRFIDATLETVDYLNNNPNYARDTYIQRTNSSNTIASKVVNAIEWHPSGTISEIGVQNLIDVYREGGDIDSSIEMKVEDTYTNEFI